MGIEFEIETVRALLLMRLSRQAWNDGDIVPKTLPKYFV